MPPSTPLSTSLAMSLPLLLSLPLLSSAYPYFVDRIPNGESIKTSSDEKVAAVGHMRIGGGGARNPFGEDFEVSEGAKE